MMSLTFSVDDILRVERRSENFSTSKIEPRDCKKFVTSDGESVRSESPESTTSDLDIKGGRRMRTMILNWQKNCLETVFEQQQYPTVQQFETLSKQLGLPHYVTKVWFQNRRSKFRKEGKREEIRTNIDPYPQRSKVTLTAQGREVTNENPQQVQGHETNQAIKDIREPTRLQQQTVCNCLQCVEASRGNDMDDRFMPKLIPRMERCNCDECISKSRIQRQQEYLEHDRQPIVVTNQQQEKEMEMRRQQIEMRQQGLCDCRECFIELQKYQKEQQYARWHIPGDKRIPVAVGERYQHPYFGGRQLNERTASNRGNTLHYVPDEQNFRTLFNLGQNKQCACKECRS